MFAEKVAARYDRPPSPTTAVQCGGSSPPTAPWKVGKYGVFRTWWYESITLWCHTDVKNETEVGFLCCSEALVQNIQCQLGIINNIGDILQIGRSSLNRENYNALFVSYSGNYLLNPDPSHYSTLGHDTGRYSTVESQIYVKLWPECVSHERECVLLSWFDIFTTFFC